MTKLFTNLSSDEKLILTMAIDTCKEAFNTNITYGEPITNLVKPYGAECPWCSNWLSDLEDTGFDLSDFEGTCPHCNRKLSIKTESARIIRGIK